jgi:4-hydroxybenzoate polyprenyltransferase
MGETGRIGKSDATAKPLAALTPSRPGAGPATRARDESVGVIELAQGRALLPSLISAMRLYQWLKNLLLFVPMVLIISQLDLREAAIFAAGFLVLGLLASGTYLINDVLDIEADRQHPTKQYRAIASGDLLPTTAVAVGVGFILVALVGAWLLLPAFGLAALAYLILTLAYSFSLKQVALLDVFVVATLFTLRVLAGMVLLRQPPSVWLLTFSVFFFLSLALMKREVELNVVQRQDKTVSHGRGYTTADRGFVTTFGIASGVASLVIFSLFVSAGGSSEANYAAPAALWGSMAVLGYWLAHMWLLTTRGEMNDDPILYAARDRTSLFLGLLTLAFALAAQVFRLT